MADSQERPLLQEPRSMDRGPAAVYRWAVGVPGVVAAVLWTALHAVTLAVYWPYLLVATVVMFIAARFRVQLSTSAGTVTLGVWISTLGFLTPAVPPLLAVPIWVAAIAVLQIVPRHPAAQVVYAIGLAAIGGTVFALVISVLPHDGIGAVAAMLPAVLAYGAVAIGSEYLLARLTFASIGRSTPVRVLPRRIAVILGVNVAICAVAAIAHQTYLVRDLDIGAGLPIRTVNAMLICALLIVIAGQYLRRVRTERKLGGLIAAARALPWGDADEIFREVEEFAKRMISAATVRIDSAPGRSFELTAAVDVPAAAPRYVVLTRRPDAGGFTSLERDALFALSHIASQALYDRRSTSLLRADAVTDPLTGLLNLRGLYATVAATGDAVARLSLLYVDIDNFKAVNDAHGHAAGDRVLQTISERIREHLRDDDLVSRIGGDEFVILVDTPRADRIAERVLHAVETPIQVGTGALTPRLSIGTPVLLANRPIGDVLNEADALMYQTKHTRRADREEERVLFEDAVHATRSGLVRVAFQPIIDVEQSRIVGFETLARYTTPDGRAIPPRLLIGAARQVGVLDTLTLQILDQALEHMTSFQAAEQTLAILTINIEADQLANPDLVAAICERHRNHEGISLCLELSEQSIASCDERVLTQIRVLTQHGIAIALDDYGQEHSDTAALLNVPAETVKIDRVFLRHESDPRSRVVLKSIINLAKDLNMRSVIEGVETQHTHDTLVIDHADRAQGFLYGTPQYPNDILERLNATGIEALKPAHRT